MTNYEIVISRDGILETLQYCLCEGLARVIAGLERSGAEIVKVSLVG